MRTVCTNSFAPSTPAKRARVWSLTSTALVSACISLLLGIGVAPAVLAADGTGGDGGNRNRQEDNRKQSSSSQSANPRSVSGRSERMERRQAPQREMRRQTAEPMRQRERQAQPQATQSRERATRDWSQRRDAARRASQSQSQARQQPSARNSGTMTQSERRGADRRAYRLDQRNAARDQRYDQRYDQRGERRDSYRDQRRDSRYDRRDDRRDDRQDYARSKSYYNAPVYRHVPAYRYSGSRYNNSWLGNRYGWNDPWHSSIFNRGYGSTHGYGYSGWGSPYFGTSLSFGSSYNRGYYGGYRGGYYDGYRRHRDNTGDVVLGVVLGAIGLAVLTDGFSSGDSQSVSVPARDLPPLAEPGIRPGEQLAASQPFGFDPESCLQTREYQTVVTIGSEAQDAYGTACLQPDGSWLQGAPKLVPRD